MGRTRRRMDFQRGKKLFFSWRKGGARKKLFGAFRRGEKFPGQTEKSRLSVVSLFFAPFYTVFVKGKKGIFFLKTICASWLWFVGPFLLPILLRIPPTLRNRQNLTETEREKFWGYFHLPEREKAFFQPTSGMAQVINAKVLLFLNLVFTANCSKLLVSPCMEYYTVQYKMFFSKKCMCETSRGKEKNQDIQRKRGAGRIFQ